MASENKTYNLGPIKQLVDLNGSSVNFRLQFTVKSLDGVPFDMLVVDQKTLDSDGVLEYKQVKDSLSGEITSDSGVYQNYFLVLKAAKPCKVQVTYTKEEIAARPVEQALVPLSSSESLGSLIEPVSLPQAPGANKSGINWKKILLLGLVIAVGVGLLWYFYTQDSDKHPQTRQTSYDVPTLETLAPPDMVETVPSPVALAPATPVPVAPAPVVSAPSIAEQPSVVAPVSISPISLQSLEADPPGTFHYNKVLDFSDLK